MKTTAKWICGNQFVIDNNQHFKLAVIDQLTSKDVEPSCLDLMMMGFAGCITSEFRKRSRQNNIPYNELDTELSIEFTKTESQHMILIVFLQTSSGAPKELIENCLAESIKASLPGILFSKAGIPIRQKILITNSQHPVFF